MKILLTADYSLHVANADGAHIYGGAKGETIDVPADIAALFVEAGVAEGVKASERASKAKGETATK